MLLRIHFLIIVSLVDSDDPAILLHLFRLAHWVNFLLAKFLLAGGIVDLKYLFLINSSFPFNFLAFRRD